MDIIINIQYKALFQHITVKKMKNTRNNMKGGLSKHH